MRIAVFGATGRTGRLVVEEALQRGHPVTAVVRQPDGIAAQPPQLRVFAADVLDAAAVELAVRGQEAVVCCIGPRRGDRTDSCSLGTSHIVAAMTVHGVRRLVCVTGAMIGHPPERLIGWIYPLMQKLMPRSQRELLGDRRQQEEIVQQSGLDWTLVRPPRLSGERLSRHYRVGADLVLDSFAHIGRADLAHGLLELLDGERCVREAVAIAY